MAVTFYEEGPALTPEQLDGIEEIIGCRFPESYRALLLAHNGGAPDPAWFRISWGGQSWAEGWDTDSVEYFLSMKSGDDTDFMEYYNSFFNRIPSDTVAIAFDAGGNLVLLGVGEDNSGKVYFWMHGFETEDAEEADYRNVGFVADTLDDMLENLFDGEEE